MTLKITITMDNAAFLETEPGAEADRILTHLADVIKRQNMGMSPGAIMPLRDLNGNHVGEAKVTR